MADLTLIDIAKRTGTDEVVGLIEQSLNYAPEVAMFPFRTVNGTAFNTLLRTAFPQGSFTQVGAGVTRGKSTYEKKLVQCFFHDNQLRVPLGVAQADDRGVDSVLADEAEGAMKQDLLDIGTQIWYGVTALGDSAGFPGAVSIVDSSMVVAASAGSSNLNSSVYGVVLNNKNVTLVGGNGKTFEASEWMKQQVDVSTGVSQTAYCKGISGYIGCQWVNKYSLGRIHNLTSTTGLTDALIYSLEAKLPAGVKFDAYFVNKAQLEKLRASRTASNPTGAPAPTPRTVGGYDTPIIVTDSIVTTEATVS